MADLGNTSIFSQVDASNGSGSMPSWLGSAAPSTIDDAGRALQGAVTREWNWRNVTLTTGGTSTAYTLTYSVAPAAYYNGQRFAFIVNATNTAAATLNVNALGAKNLRKMVNGTATALNAGDLAAGAYCEVAYNTVGDYFVILNRDLSMLVPDSNANGFLRNRIINGDMRIDQRNAGASVTPASSGYTLDRWEVGISVASKFSVQQNAGSVTRATGFPSYLGTTSLFATAVGAGDIYVVRQKIEGYNVSDLGWGAAGAQAVTLSFWVRSSLTGTFGGSIQNSAANRSYPFTYAISAANTWEQKTITIPGDTSGSWDTTTGIGITVNFGLGVGATYSGTASTWAAADYRSATSAVQVVATNAATWYVTGVQLEAGSASTPFERRQYGQELALCQRYYENIGIAAAMFPWNSTSTIVRTTVSFAVQKRAVPLVTLGTKTSGTGTLAVIDTTVNAVLLGGTGSVNDVVVYNTPTASAEL